MPAAAPLAVAVAAAAQPLAATQPSRLRRNIAAAAVARGGRHRFAFRTPAERRLLPRGVLWRPESVKSLPRLWIAHDVCVRHVLAVVCWVLGGPTPGGVGRWAEVDSSQTVGAAFEHYE